MPSHSAASEGAADSEGSAPKSLSHGGLRNRFGVRVRLAEESADASGDTLHDSGELFVGRSRRLREGHGAIEMLFVDAVEREHVVGGRED